MEVGPAQLKVDLVVSIFAKCWKKDLGAQSTDIQVATIWPVDLIKKFNSFDQNTVEHLTDSNSSEQ